MAKKNPILPGYKSLGGSSRRYRTPSGSTISRREYENRRLQTVGWRSWAHYQKTKKSDEWLKQEGIYADKQGLKRSQVGPTSDFALAYLGVENARDSGDEDALYDPDGPLAEWLVLIGRRQPDDYWDVGDTPGAAAK